MYFSILAITCVQSTDCKHMQNNIKPYQPNNLLRIDAAIENLQNSYVNYFGYSNSNNSNSNSNNITNNNQKNNAQTNNANTNTQWSVWQQFPWPYIQPEQNRWSKLEICVS